MKLKHLLSDCISLFFPDLCAHCGEALMEGEAFFCLHCLLDLPKTRYCSFKNNAASERFRGKIPLENATAYLYYNKGGIGQELIGAIKYKGNIRLAKWIGSRLAKELLPSGFFEGIDYLIPIPLHAKKLKRRGFNQSEIIAEGIASVTHIPLETNNLFRKQANITQTKKGIYERWKNTSGIFQIKDKQLFSGKHLLLIDDVLTTGATLEANAVCLLKSSNVKISILTVAIA